MSEKLNRLLRKLKQYPVALIATLLVMAFGVALFLRSSRLAELEQELVEAEAEWGRMEANLRRSHNLENHLEAIREIETAIQSRLMRPSEVAINYDYFYRIERESDIRLTALDQGGVINPKEEGEGGMPRLSHFSAINYTIGIEGRFPEILRFMSRVQHGRFFVRIGALNLSSSNQGGAEWVNANLQCQILGVAP